MFRLFVVLLTVPASLVHAVELQISHLVIQRVLAQQVFTDEGRKYVRANRASRCSFAYLEQPEVGAENGRLRIRARFTGRAGVDLFGRCMSLGDSFVAVIRATPYYKDGAVWLKAVEVSSEDRDGLYVRRVRAEMARSLSTQFSYRVADEARRILEQPATGAMWKQQMMSFDVRDIRVTQDAVVANVEFTLAVR
jgi:hypothetical protein